MAASDNLDNWLVQVREMLDSGETDAVDFIDEFKLNLNSEEIYVFTPNGDLFNLPKAMRHHPRLCLPRQCTPKSVPDCIGAKVNHKLVPSPMNLRAATRSKSLPRASKAEGGLAQVRGDGQAACQIPTPLGRGTPCATRKCAPSPTSSTTPWMKDKLRKWIRRKEMLPSTIANIDSLVTAWTARDF